MRSLALLLLLANIMFLGWQLSWLPSWLPWQPSDFIKDVPSEAPPVSDLPRLVLLNESHSVGNVASVSTSDKISHGQVSTDNPSKTNGLAPVESVGIKRGDETSKAMEGKELLTGKMTPVYNNDTNVSEKHGSFENTGAARESVDTHQNGQDVNPGKNIGKMSTDSTTGGAHTVAASTSLPAPEWEKTAKPKNSPLAEEVKVAPAAQAPIKVAPVKKASSMTCFKVGPYLPLAEAKKVADWLKSQGEVGVEVKNREIPVSTKTWVYLPPLGSRQEALRVVQRLTQQGIKDVTGQGIESNNAISLGVFKNKENAVRRVKELQAKGYNGVKTEEHHENETTYWLSVKIADNPKSVLSAFGKRFKEAPVLEEGTCE